MPSPLDRQTAHRIYGLDGLRFFAALAVALYHYTGIRRDFWGEPVYEVFPALNHITKYGFLGVHLFFVISGYVILMTAYNRSLPSFTASRVSRLYPAYWVAVILTVALQYFWKGGRTPSLADSLLNLTMFQRGFGAMDVQGAFWTLWVELLFYILIGTFIIVGITERRVFYFALLWPLAAEIAQTANTPFLSTILIPSHASLFATGMLLFLLRKNGSSLSLWLGVVFNTVISIYNVLDQHSHSYRSRLVLAFLVVFIMASVWFVTSGPGSRITWSALTSLGNLTYPLYLIHGQFGFFLIGVLYPALDRWLVLAITLAAVIALACLLHYAVERPFHRKLRLAVKRGLDSLSAKTPSESQPRTT